MPETMSPTLLHEEQWMPVRQLETGAPDEGAICPMRMTAACHSWSLNCLSRAFWRISQA